MQTEITVPEQQKVSKEQSYLYISTEGAVILKGQTCLYTNALGKDIPI